MKYKIKREKLQKLRNNKPQVVFVQTELINISRLLEKKMTKARTKDIIGITKTIR